MRDMLTLLALTADLHAAARKPQHWPAAWTAVCQWFECPDVFGNGDVSAINTVTLLADIAVRSSGARLCAQTAEGRCGQGDLADEIKRRSCCALVEHLDLALGNTQVVAPGGPAAAYLAALDTLPVAMMLCRPDRHLLHANPAGMNEVERQRWLRVEDGELIACGAVMPAIFSNAFSELASSGNLTTRLISTPQIDGNAADIGLRALANGDSEALILVSLVTHIAEHTEAQLASIGERRMLPPRQRELAGLLLGGYSLDSAAEQMGVTRRTAKGHLEGLFRATGTRRQQDLIVRLERDLQH